MDLLNWKRDIDQDLSIPPIDWDALIEFANSIKRGQSEGTAPSQGCQFAPIYDKGGVHLVRLLVFEDGTKWVARVQLGKDSPHSKTLLLSEKDALGLVRARTDVPVPMVLGYDDSPERIGRRFMIMEFIPGSTAMNACGGATDSWRRDT